MIKKRQLIINQTDHGKLIDCMTTDRSSWNDAGLQKEDVYEKLITASIISDADFRRDVSRLYSIVTLRDTIARINHNYKLLPPNEVDSKSDGVSVLSPFGFALLGRPVGSTFTWQFKKRKVFPCC